MALNGPDVSYRRWHLTSEYYRAAGIPVARSRYNLNRRLYNVVATQPCGSMASTGDYTYWRKMSAVTLFDFDMKIQMVTSMNVGHGDSFNMKEQMIPITAS